MLQLLYSMMALNFKGGIGDRRSLHSLRFGARKKKRHTMERELQLSTGLNLGTVAARSDVYVESVAKR